MDLKYYYLEYCRGINTYSVYFSEKIDLIDILILFLDSKCKVYIDDFGVCYCNDNLTNDDNNKNIDMLVNLLTSEEE